jgi:hypothetical protein
MAKIILVSAHAAGTIEADYDGLAAAGVYLVMSPGEALELAARLTTTVAFNLGKLGGS